MHEEYDAAERWVAEAPPPDNETPEAGLPQHPLLRYTSEARQENVADQTRQLLGWVANELASGNAVIFDELTPIRNGLWEQRVQECTVGELYISARHWELADTTQPFQFPPHRPMASVFIYRRHRNGPIVGRDDQRYAPYRIATASSEDVSVAVMQTNTPSFWTPTSLRTADLLQIVHAIAKQRESAA